MKRTLILLLLLAPVSAPAQNYFPARQFVGMAGRDYPLPPQYRPPPQRFYTMPQAPVLVPHPPPPPPHIAQRDIPRPRPDAESAPSRAKSCNFATAMVMSRFAGTWAVICEARHEEWGLTMGNDALRQAAEDLLREMEAEAARSKPKVFGLLRRLSPATERPAGVSSPSIPRRRP